jgi:antitoxin (DNA-binding transcriptional repressor) of toxin-antitoxin stability system
MRTVTMRDLRKHFASVAKWIEDGEMVAITRNGAAFAMLTPAAKAKAIRADWKSRALKRKPLGRQLSAHETEAFWSRLRD